MKNLPGVNNEELDKYSFFQTLCRKCQQIVQNRISSGLSVDSELLCKFDRVKCERRLNQSKGDDV